MFTYSIDELINSKRKIDTKVALVSNSSAFNKNYESTFSLLKEKYNIVALFAPEHGFNSIQLAGENVEHTTDKNTNIKIYSLYNKGKFSISEEMLNIFDTIIFDIQDLGLRFYTYISTLKYIIQSLSNTDKKLIILDRPAILNGTTVEGNVLDEKSQSFIGPKDLPIRYGLTIGELANYFNIENNYNCDLEIIKMSNWERTKDYDDYNLPWIKPSPAIPSFNTSLLYSGTCLFEGTNISVARGTYSPFEMIGSPFIDEIKFSKDINNLKIPGIITTPTIFKPKFNKYKEEICKGLYFHITDKRKAEPIYFAITILKYLRDNYKEFILDDNNTNHTAKLLGYDFEEKFNNQTTTQLIDQFREQSKKFKEYSKKYHLY
ncbi:MAG: DUF1343 domain-containing protein [Sphaerochaetaceae bacterium]|nr:DUF1343 domain-containing protein [Sphaerochaetaceae bacterium]